MKFTYTALAVSALAASSIVEAANLTEADEVASLFDATQIISYNLVMTEDSIAFLNADPTQEVYVPCNVTLNYVDPLTESNVDTVEPLTLIGAGCRYKGSSGSYKGCVSTENGSYGAIIENSTSCRTLSWKVDSNEFADDYDQESKQRFYGLKKLVFNGIQDDDSMIGERLAYTVLGERLTNSPRVAVARVFVNDEYYGVYDFIEEVDDIFVDSHYTEENVSLGAMWKEVWYPCAGHPNPTYDLNINDFEPKEYGDDDFTGLDKLSEVAQLSIECLAGDNCDETAAQAILDGRVDSTSFLNTMVVNYLLLNWDSAHRLFADSTDNSYYNHNYYLYVPQNGTIEYIPWDYSEALIQASCGFDDAYSSTEDGFGQGGGDGGQGGRPTAEGTDNSTQAGNVMTTEEMAAMDTDMMVTPPEEGVDATAFAAGGSPTGGQRGQRGQGGDTTTTCPETPHWFDTTFDQSLCNVTGSGGRDSTMPFACDPVGHIMALAWKTQFLELMAVAQSQDNFLGGINDHAKVFAVQVAYDVERYANQGGIPSYSDFQWGVVNSLQKAGTESMYWFTYANNATSFA
ncbi:hypothetical protein SARC_13118 [Sphaeroforma arctica JP610]|uniref:Spore coat protein CotH n=1 Tax=Sphaeroforma arctica JP610 TaxID=667725 RepID=A0A0L0FCW6_9EUKA|nr:hypothetical protein SARC_13118 [Sphaeroforma arctica JP610]KNC74331.1 hypothetical protein SARC_13118 [Sphaeroforma arctica JP610]|eukprot:XP_014148233.1 hypothetical protein SARC_13118 [Sphaeroforma arctica JP610]